MHLHTTDSLLQLCLSICTPVLLFEITHTLTSSPVHRCHYYPSIQSFSRHWATPLIFQLENHTPPRKEVALCLRKIVDRPGHAQGFGTGHGRTGRQSARAVVAAHLEGGGLGDDLVEAGLDIVAAAEGIVLAIVLADGSGLGVEADVLGALGAVGVLLLGALGLGDGGEAARLGLLVEVLFCCAAASAVRELICRERGNFTNLVGGALALAGLVVEETGLVAGLALLLDQGGIALVLVDGLVDLEADLLGDEGVLGADDRAMLVVPADGVAGVWCKGQARQIPRAPCQAGLGLSRGGKKETGASSVHIPYLTNSFSLR